MQQLRNTMKLPHALARSSAPKKLGAWKANACALVGTHQHAWRKRTCGAWRLPPLPPWPLPPVLLLPGFAFLFAIAVEASWGPNYCPMLVHHRCCWSTALWGPSCTYGGLALTPWACSNALEGVRQVQIQLMQPLSSRW